MSEASVTPDQISTFSNIYRHTSPLLTLYHLIPSITNLYWPITGQYCHKLTQYHQVPLLIHHLVRHSSANYIIFLFTTHLMSHAQFTWSSFLHSSPKTTASWLSQTWKMRRQGREGRRAAIQATAGGIQEEQLIFVRKKTLRRPKSNKNVSGEKMTNIRDHPCGGAGQGAGDRQVPEF